MTIHLHTGDCSSRLQDSELERLRIENERLTAELVKEREYATFLGSAQCRERVGVLEGTLRDYLGSYLASDSPGRRLAKVQRLADVLDGAVLAGGEAAPEQKLGGWCDTHGGYTGTVCAGRQYDDRPCPGGEARKEKP